MRIHWWCYSWFAVTCTTHRAGRSVLHLPPPCSLPILYVCATPSPRWHMRAFPLPLYCLLPFLHRFCFAPARTFAHGAVSATTHLTPSMPPRACKRCEDAAAPVQPLGTPFSLWMAQRVVVYFGLLGSSPPVGMPPLVPLPSCRATTTPCPFPAFPLLLLRLSRHMPDIAA